MDYYGTFLQYYKMGNHYKGPLVVFQRFFTLSGPKVLHPAIFMLLLLKHCHLLN